MKKVDRITVTVHPGSSRRKLEIREDGTHIYTTAKPVEGKANRDVVKLLSEHYHVPKKDILLVKGLKSRKKIFEVYHYQ